MQTVRHHPVFSAMFVLIAAGSGMYSLLAERKHSKVKLMTWGHSVVIVVRQKFFFVQSTGNISFVTCNLFCPEDRRVFFFGGLSSIGTLVCMLNLTF